MADVSRNLERAEKYVTRGKFSAAVDEYLTAYRELPQDLNLLRTVADLCVRAERKEDALRYYGELFDRYAEKNDATRGVPLFRKSLQDSPQPPARWAGLGRLLERAKKTDEALEAHRTALGLYRRAGDTAGILQELESLAALEPENADSQVALGEHASRLNRTGVAARAFLRAGQLLRTENLERALQLLLRAHELTPDRSTALTLAQAQLDHGNPREAAELLQPFYAESQEDPAVLETLAAALLAAGQLPQAEEVLEVFYQSRPDGYDKLFALSDLYIKAGESARGVELLGRVKQRLFAAKRQKDFVARVEEVFKANENDTPLAEFAARTFNELNQESRYGMVLERLFDLYVAKKDITRAAETLERLIDIDPYDYENQARIQKIHEQLDPARVRSITARIAGAATVPGQAPASAVSEEEPDLTGLDPARRRALLDDMIVQVEIFLQYELKAKAIEKLQQVYKHFAGEEAGNERLYRLYEAAQYFPPGLKSPADAATGAPAFAGAPPPGPAPSSSGTVGDLAKISEITHILYRQSTPKTALHIAVSELGKYLRASRCLGVLGKPGKPPSTAVEYCAPGVPQSPGSAVMKLLGLLAQVSLDPETGAVLEVGLTPDLRQAGAQSVLAMPLANKESQEQEGMIVLSQAESTRRWQPNEVYLLKAVADQVATAISHAKLRTLMKRLSVADDPSGLLARSSYLDCLVSEAGRAKVQGTPLVVLLLELDRGGQLLRQFGDAPMRRFMQQVGEAVLANIRQTDLAFRYTATSVAVLLGDTTGEKVSALVDKLRGKLGELSLPSGKDSITFSAGVSEAAIRPDYDPADIVTDVINRVELSLEEACQHGNSVVVR